MNPSSSRRAFTLVELLVTISIIAILAAILVPSLSTAQESSRIAHCANNLNQIGKGLQMYADANKDFLPKMFSGTEGGVTYASWANRIVDFVGSPNIFACMSDPAGHAPGDRTYSANGQSGGGNQCPFSDGNQDKPMRMGDLDFNQGDIILVGERSSEGLGSGRGTMSNDKLASLDLTPGEIHRRGKSANYLFGSMAVKLIKTQDALTPAPGVKGNYWTLVTQ